ncbi:MAG TPA: ABC transporter ATP-binding protein [Thermoanaerobaculia bacterium]|nr:ABC transporter ATP-binding protein [Thermoanaerobaculia bacterium]
MRLVLEAVSHRYPGAPSDAPGAVSAVLEAGEKGLLEGPVGAGKTTLLLRIAGLREGPGRVLAGDREVTRRSAPAIRRALGFLWQNPDDGLFLPGVLEDVALGPLNDGVSPEEALERARVRLDDVGAAHLASREIATLSRGERQLVALAGIFARDPGLLLLDEPLSALDGGSRERVLALLARNPATVLLATHDASGAAHRAGFRPAVRLAAAATTRALDEA